jgi:imidazolonepropionase-like amidohydrolase
MTIRARIVALLLLLSPAIAHAETSYVRAGKLIDTVQGRVLNDQLIRIVGGRIASVEGWKTAPSDGAVTDWSGYTVLPGLMDMHTHLADFGQTNNVAEPLLHSAAETALLRASPRCAMSAYSARLAMWRCATQLSRGPSTGHA